MSTGIAGHRVAVVDTDTLRCTTSPKAVWMNGQALALRDPRGLVVGGLCDEDDFFRSRFCQRFVFCIVYVLTASQTTQLVLLLSRIIIEPEIEILHLLYQ